MSQRQGATAPCPHMRKPVMPDFTAHRHPVLAVRCPECGKAPGLWCIRPSGHRANDLHLRRRAQADLVFIEQHGPDASIARIEGGWTIDPQGRSGLRPQPEPVAPAPRTGNHAEPVSPPD